MVHPRSAVLPCPRIGLGFLPWLSALLPPAVVAAFAQAPAPSCLPTHWPIKDGTYVIHDFKFGTGQTLPELSL